MNLRKFIFIDLKITSSSSGTSAVKNLLKTSKDPTIINSVPCYLLSGFSRSVASDSPASNISASNLPTAYVKNLFYLF